jgi:hypothetical protein
MNTKLEITTALLEAEGVDVSSLEVEGYGKKRIRCPWCEGPPSAVLYASGNFRCFRCNIFGDAFDLLLATKGLRFPAAQAYLADNDINAIAPSKATKEPPAQPEKKPYRASWDHDDDDDNHGGPGHNDPT